MAYANYTRGECKEIEDNLDSYPPEFRRLYANYRRAVKDWNAACSVLGDHRLLAEFRRKRKKV